MQMFCISGMTPTLKKGPGDKEFSKDKMQRYFSKCSRPTKFSFKFLSLENIIMVASKVLGNVIETYVNNFL